MAAMLTETPSRIWRRIEAVEDRDMPSLPSLPGFEDSQHSVEIEENSGMDNINESDIAGHSPIHSTPALSSHYSSTASRNPSSTSSTHRFANSLAKSRSSVGQSLSKARQSRSRSYSFDVSAIPSLPDVQPERGTYHQLSEDDEEEFDLSQSKSSVPDAYLPPNQDDEDEDDISFSEPSEFNQSQVQPTPRKPYIDTMVSLRSEPRPSPMDLYKNISLRRPLSRTRTPSLTRTTMSPTSSPSNSTPQSTRSRSLAPSPSAESPVRSLRASATSPLPAATIPLPRSTTASPAVRTDKTDSLSVDFSDRGSVRSETQSMDITEGYISPMRDPQSEEGGSGSEPDFQQNHSNGKREPTFSSEGEDTPYQTHGEATTGVQTAASSPAQSIAFTPTPAFPRPRARFNLETPADDLLATPRNRDSPEEEEPLTPHTRRKSFLLSIVNSTARPRMKMPTPHPRFRVDLNDTLAVEGTPGPPDVTATPGLGTAVNLQRAFAGATPLPRPRLGRSSHPLARGFTASDSDSDSGGASPSSYGQTKGTLSKPSLRRVSFGASPAGYDGAMDRASFISTASSHDLTTNIRANTSFDPAMGFGVGAQATGRFNAGKLNTYLHGLNRRLQEENEILVERLRRLEQGGSGSPQQEGDISATSSRRQSSGSKRRLSAGPALGDVVEDVGGEGWMAEKAELEEMVEVYKDEVEKNVIEREELEKALDDEKKERTRDQERWKERMAEVEKGVDGIIGDLEAKLQDAESRAKHAQTESLHHLKELQLEVEGLMAERDLAQDRAEKAEKALSSGLELGSELKEANQRVSNLMSDVRNMNSQIREMEQAAGQAEERTHELETQLKEERDLVKELEKELNIKMDELDVESDKFRHAQAEIHNVASELDGTKAYVSELEAANRTAANKVEGLSQELEAVSDEVLQIKAENEDKEQRLVALEAERDHSAELQRQMEEALEAAEQKMADDDDELARLKARLVTLEREKERALETSRRHSEPSRNLEPIIDNAELEALEEELDDAHREIARLTTMMDSSPVRKTMDKAKDMRIEMLEKDNEALLERIKTWKYNTADLTTTPSRLVNNNAMSPIYRQVMSMAIRTPKTPGGPLKDLTWLHNSTMDGESMAPVVAEISRLRRELDEANESVDDKMDKLEDAGLGVVALTRKLGDARTRIVALEDEIARLSRKEERRTCRLEKARCQKCLTKVKILDVDESATDLSRSSMPSEPPTPPTRTSEALKSDLKIVNTQLASMKKDWEKERQQLISEKGVLQDVANQLNDKIRTFAMDANKASQKDEAGQTLRAEIQSDLDKARRTIAELEGALSTERAQLRNIIVEQNKVSQEREQVLAQLRCIEADMEDVKQQMQRTKKDNQAMERELRENATVEQKARLLESRVAENAETIEHLRQERSVLANDHKALQKKFSEVSEHANRLRDDHASSQQTHDNRRHQLDLHMIEIEALRRALSDQSEELHRVEAEKKRISSERSEVSRTVATLEADLRRVRKDAEAFGKDLKVLRTEKEKAEAKLAEDTTKSQRVKKQAESQIRLLSEQVELQKNNAAKWRKQVEVHVCAMDEQQLSAIRMQHNKECKGLIVQIRYLKAKYTRETTLRLDLVYQKQYLMLLLGRFERSERTIISAISRIGGLSVEPPAPPRQRRKLKSVVTMVVFLTRIRRSSEEWQKQCESKEAVAAALQDVRKRRLIKS